VTGRLLVALARQVKELRRHAHLVAARAGVRERLAAALVELGQRCGSQLPSGARRIELPLSCELLGQISGLEMIRTSRWHSALLLAFGISI
jgi:CRP-like cAMP-binding protein